LNASSANDENARRRVGQPALGPRALQLSAALQLLGREGGRAEMRPHGICVISVFPGPVNDERNQMLSPNRGAIAKPLKERIKNDDPERGRAGLVERWREFRNMAERWLAAGG
jgi:NAD(P)-dependent dehydrogenase (short-subunit alcohol dehydrogenase family)